MILYHGATQRGLKYIDPNKNVIKHNNESHRKVYASPDKAYASLFTFTWKESEGFKLQRLTETEPWELKIPPKYSSRLNHSCSIYIVDDKPFVDENMSTPEYSSNDSVKVLKEETYDSALECMRMNGVKVSILKRKPFMDNTLTKEFKDVIENR